MHTENDDESGQWIPVEFDLDDVEVYQGCVLSRVELNVCLEQTAL